MARLPLPSSRLTHSSEGASHLRQGQLNHQRLVAPSADFRWQSRWSEAAQEVFVTGDFTGWAVRTHRAAQPGTFPGRALMGRYKVSLVQLAAGSAVLGCCAAARRNCCPCGGTPGPVTSACRAACRCA